MNVKRLLAVAAVLAVGALFFFMSTAGAKQTCRVCMDFRGRSNCATAVGHDVHEATQTAQNTACGPLVQGMDQTIACGNTAPRLTQCQPR
jgi:hypothetical protein